MVKSNIICNRLSQVNQLFLRYIFSSVKFISVYSTDHDHVTVSIMFCGKKEVL